MSDSIGDPISDFFTGYEAARPIFDALRQAASCTTWSCARRTRLTTTCAAGSLRPTPSPRRAFPKSPPAHGNLLQRVIYHAWYHTGENMAIRQLLGHARLPVYVGDIDGKAPYRTEGL